MTFFGKWLMTMVVAVLCTLLFVGIGRRGNVPGVIVVVCSAVIGATVALLVWSEETER